MAITNKENCMVDWVKGVTVVAIACIYYAALVLMDVFVISRNSGINRLMCKGGHSISCSCLHYRESTIFKIYEFDVGSIGG